MKVIIGLGNPGNKYKNNRHNAGFMVVDYIAQQNNVCFRRSLLSLIQTAKLRVGQEDVLLVKPQAFMNNSGQEVKKVLAKNKINIKDVLVVYDELDLPLGVIRFKVFGSSAGHRGMESIINALALNQINRLRLGIGRPIKGDAAEYVLADFSLSEKIVFNEIIEQASIACVDWVNQGEKLSREKYNKRGSAV